MQARHVGDVQRVAQLERLVVHHQRLQQRHVGGAEGPSVRQRAVAESDRLERWHVYASAIAAARTVDQQVHHDLAHVVAQLQTLQAGQVYASRHSRGDTVDADVLEQREHVVADHQLLHRAVRQLEGVHVVEGGEALAALQAQRLQRGQVYGSARCAAPTGDVELAVALEVVAAEEDGGQHGAVCASEPRETLTLDDEGLALPQRLHADVHRAQVAEV